MAMRAYRSGEGEMVDEICQHYYGRTRGVVEKVLALDENKGLAGRGPRLAAGTLVYLPEIEEPAGAGDRQEEIWD